ncbi:MAG: hypothetical protein LBF65_01805 [Holosporales bacterium]|jgi:hypothetical protein|nr:hypothetical protein [Holosporales bacterium]
MGMLQQNLRLEKGFDISILRISKFFEFTEQLYRGDQNYRKKFEGCP